MTYDEAVAALRAWCGERVVVELLPEESRMQGVLSELDPAGVDGALFAVDAEAHSGVAVALFRDGVDGGRLADDRLEIRQGRVTVIVYLWR